MSEVKKLGQEIKKETEKVAAEVKKEAVKAAESAKPVVEKAKAGAAKAKRGARKAAKSTEKKAVETAEKAKTGVRRAAEKAVKGEGEATVYVQFLGKEEKVDDLIAAAKAAFAVDHARTKVADLKLYIKPEDNAAYYVINEKFAGKIDF